MIRHIRGTEMARSIEKIYSDPKRKKMSKVDDFFNHLETLGKMKEELWRFFYWDCPLWAAIRDHIDSESCVLIDKEGGRIAQHRGHGPAISFKEAYLWTPDYVKDKQGLSVPVPRTEFAIKFDVEYDDDNWEGSTRQSYTIAAPLELVKNYSDRGFKKWISKKRKERQAEQFKEDRQTYQKLKKRYPALHLTLGE